MTLFIREAGKGRDNVSLILSAVRAAGVTTRSELVDTTGLGSGTVTRITGRLVRAGLLAEESASVSAGRGRPRVPLTLDETYFRVATVHIGLTNISCGLVSLTGSLIDQIVLDLPSRSVGSVVNGACEGVRQLLRRHSAAPVLGVGATTVGRVDSAAGVVISQPGLGWQDVELGSILNGRLGLSVRIDSTLHALALMECRIGQMEEVDGVLVVFVGNTVGAALVIHGQPVVGSSASTGSIEHLPTDGRGRTPCTCGGRKCLQAVASNLAVLDAAREEGVIEAGEGMESLCLAASSGNRRAARLLRRRARHLGQAVGLLVEVLDPDRVVLVGRSLRDDDIEVVQQSAGPVIERTRPVDAAKIIGRSRAGDRPLVTASAVPFLDGLFRDPTAYVDGLERSLDGEVS